MEVGQLVTVVDDARQLNEVLASKLAGKVVRVEAVVIAGRGQLSSFFPDCTIRITELDEPVSWVLRTKDIVDGQDIIYW